MTGLEKPQITVIRYQLVDSTSRIAFELATQGSAQGTVVLAETQSGGRGRLSRQFCSPPGGIYMSVILRPELTAEQMALVTLAAGVAVAEAVEQASGVSVHLKWPNDLYADGGRKLGGILSEAAPYSTAQDNIPFVVVGIGLNTNTRSTAFPLPLQDLATSLYCVTGREYDILALAGSVANLLLEKVLQLVNDAEGILAEWRKRDFLLGKKLCWQDPQGWVVHGMGNGLLPDGGYRLTTSGGDDYPVLAGDILLTDINGKHIR